MQQLSRLISDKAIRSALHRLPKGLDGVYIQVLQQLEADHQDNLAEVLRVFWWLVGGIRPLTLAALAEAISSDSWTTSLDFSRVATDPPHVVYFCSSLVTVDRISALP